MTSNSRKWTIADATAGLQGEVTAMSQGGFRLIGAAALMYVSGVYWETPRLQANEVGNQIHAICASLNYGKSSRYQLASAALRVARNLTKKWGQPDAVKDRNVAWTMLQDAARFAEAVDFMVSQIKTDYAVATLSELYTVFAGKQSKLDTVKPLSEQFEAAIKRSQAMADGITDAILVVVDQHLGSDQINTLLIALAARLTDLHDVPIKRAA